MKPTEILSGEHRVIEQVLACLGTHEKYLRVADELAERFGVTQAVGNACRACACSHG